jgi:hypothetical protein
MKSKLFIEERLVKGEWVPLGLWVDQSFRNLLERTNKIKDPPIWRFKRVKTLEEYQNLDKTNIFNVPSAERWLSFIEWIEVSA